MNLKIRWTILLFIPDRSRIIPPDGVIFAFLPLIQLQFNVLLFNLVFIKILILFYYWIRFQVCSLQLIIRFVTSHSLPSPSCFYCYCHSAHVLHSRQAALLTVWPATHFPCAILPTTEAFPPAMFSRKGSQSKKQGFSFKAAYLTLLIAVVILSERWRFDRTGQEVTRRRVH